VHDAPVGQPQQVKTATDDPIQLWKPQTKLTACMFVQRGREVFNIVADEGKFPIVQASGDNLTEFILGVWFDHLNDHKIIIGVQGAAGETVSRNAYLVGSVHFSDGALENLLKNLFLPIVEDLPTDKR